MAHLGTTKIAGDLTVSGLVRITSDHVIRDTLELGYRASNNEEGRYFLLEGAALPGNGEAYGRWMFTEHNATTGNAEAYGVSFSYQGDSQTLTLPSSHTVDNGGNARWALKGHDASVAGFSIMSGSRSSPNVDFYGRVAAVFMKTTQNIANGDSIPLHLDYSTADGAAPAIRLGQPSSGPGFWDIQPAGTNAGDLSIEKNDTEVLRITAGGNLGINTANPLEKLHVYGNALIDGGTNTTVTIKSDDTGRAQLELYGDSQGTGRVYVGQDTGYGGGIEFNGDSSPNTTGAGDDYFTLWRRDNGSETWTARNKYNSNDWEFRGSLEAFNGFITGAESVLNATYNGMTKISHTSNNTNVPFQLEKSGTTLTDSSAYGMLRLARLNHNNTDTAAGSNLFFVLKSDTGSEEEYAGIGGTKTAAGATGGKLVFYRHGRSVLGDWDSDGLDIQQGGLTVTGTTVMNGNVNIPNGYIKFGPGSAANDDAHIEWLGGNNAGHLRISTGDDASEYIEFGDYDGQNRAGVFTEWARFQREELQFHRNTRVTSSSHLDIGPNSTWGATLRLGGDGHTDTSKPTVTTTDGNLHIDASGDRGIYFGNYAGSGLVEFRDGATNTNVSISNTGVEINAGPISFNDVSRYWLVTATNWGVYWDTANNQIEFHGAGTPQFNFDLDDGNQYMKGSLHFNDTDVQGIYFNSGVANSGSYIRQLSGGGGELDIGSDGLINFKETDQNATRAVWDMNSGRLSFQGDGSIEFGGTQNRQKIKLSGDSNAHDIGFENYHNTYGPSNWTDGIIGHKFFGNTNTLVAQLGEGDSTSNNSQLRSFFFGNVVSLSGSLSASSPNATVVDGLTRYFEVRAPSGASYPIETGYVFHHESISTSTLKYKNISNGDGEFVFDSDDTNHTVRSDQGFTSGNFEIVHNTSKDSLDFNYVG